MIRNIIKNKSFIFLFIIIFSFLSNTNAEEEYAKLGSGREGLLLLEIPTVITSARKEQKITESPVAISCVDGEDIKFSGATSISEVLRNNVGVHFGYVTHGYMNAGGIRGFNKFPSNKIVFMFDSIPYMQEIYYISGEYGFPFLPNEIERIEVLRGPGSSLYGANAMFGVINVITKNTEDLKGTFFNVRGGEFGTLICDVGHGGGFGKMNYFFTAGMLQRNNWGYIAYIEDPLALQYRGSGRITYYINDNMRLDLRGGYTFAPKLYFPFDTTGPIDCKNAELYYSGLDFIVNSPNIVIRLFSKFDDATKDGGFAPLAKIKYAIKENTHLVEVQSNLEPFNNDSLILGGSYSKILVDTIVIGGEKTKDNYGLFVDNNYKLLENLHVNAGIRFDNDSFTGNAFSPRAALVYLPLETQKIRLTWGTSYRNPDFVEFYYDDYNIYKTNYPYPTWTTYTHVYPKCDKPEKAETIELGYLGRITDNINLETNLFYTTVKDFIYYVETGRTVDLISKKVIIDLPFQNLGNAIQQGAEIEVKYIVNNWLSFLVNYTYLDQKYKDEEDKIIEPLLTKTPKNMVNAQIRTKFNNGLSASLTLNYRDSSEWSPVVTWYNPLIPPPGGPTIVGGKSEAYTILSLYVGYTINKNSEVSLSAFNLLDTKYDDYPIDTQDIRRRIILSLSYKF